MTEKKGQHEEQTNKEDKFTGSPEQQLPDLEAEDKQVRQEEQFEESTNSDEKKD